MRTKSSLRIQKFVFYGFLIVAFLVFIASLCFVADGWVIFKAESGNASSGFYHEFPIVIQLAKQELKGDFDAKYPLILANMANGVYSTVFTSAKEANTFYRTFWFNIQAVNNLLFYTALITLALVAVCGITGSFTRKKFYISNLVSGVVTGAFAIVMSIMTIIKTIGLVQDFNYVKTDIEYYLQAMVDGGGTNISDTVNAGNCVIAFVSCGVLIILSIGFIAYNVFRFVKTREMNKGISLNGEVAIND